jgi:MIP family channel proteins
MDFQLRELVAEVVGTFALVFIGAAAIISDAGLIGVALAHGLVLAIAISALGRISGGVFNPAVAVGLALTGKISWSKAVAYTIAQLVGGTVAGFLLLAIFPESAVSAASLGTPLVAQGVSAWQAVLLEAVLTFLLMTAIMGTAVDAKGPRNLAGFGIGLVLVFDILAGGKWTGASMNPARTFGPAVAGGYWDLHWVYWVGPIVGAAAAALLYEHLLAKESASSGGNRTAA